MSKLIEVQATKEFASTFLNDIFFKMAVNRVLDAAPGFDLVRCKDCIHFDPKKALRPGGIWCEYWGTDPDPEDWCCKGERKDND